MNKRIFIISYHMMIIIMVHPILVLLYGDVLTSLSSSIIIINIGVKIELSFEFHVHLEINT